MAIKQLSVTDNAKLIKQIKAEVEESRKFVKSKREDFKDRLKLYNNQKKDNTKVGIMDVYAYQNVFMAISYIDQLSVVFEAREKGDQAKSSVMTDVAKFDYDEMGMSELDFFTKWDKYFYGVGIQYVGSWDKERKVPLPRSFSPLLWLPDPSGYSNGDQFRWHGIEDELNKSEMTAANGYYEAQTKDLEPEKNIDSGVHDAKQAISEAQNTDLQIENSTDVSDAKIEVVHQFTTFKGHKILATVDSNCDKVLRYVVFDPVSDAEKKNPLLVSWGIVLRYFSPLRGDPFGVSLTDLVEDKQRAKSILANIQLLKEQAALWPMYMYNRQKILNRKDLDFAFNKFIAVNGDVAGAVEPMKKDLNSGTSINQEQKITAETQFVTGTDQMQMGVLSAEKRTKFEVQQVTVNANIRQMLNSKIEAWGEKAFWIQWARMYDKFFSDQDEKVISIIGSMGTRYKSIKRKDFSTKKDPNIVIKSKLESDAKKEKKRLAYAQVLPFILENPGLPQASKNFALRRNLSYIGLEDDEIEALVPKTPSEMDAYMENELLERNEFHKLSEQDDHIEHIFVHNQVEDTTAKHSHIQAHWQAYMLSAQRMRDEAMAIAKEGKGSSAATNIAQAQVGAQASHMAAQGVDTVSPESV